MTSHWLSRSCLSLALAGYSLTPAHRAIGASPAEEYQALEREYQRAQRDWGRAMADARLRTEARRRAWLARNPDPIGRFAPRYLDFADRHSREGVAVDALRNAFAAGRTGATGQRAYELLKRDHLSSLRGVQILPGKPSDWRREDYAIATLMAGKLTNRNDRVMVTNLVENVLKQARLFPAETLLRTRRSGVTPGCYVPEVQGVDSRGDTLRLSAHRGRTVLLVFWKDQDGETGALHARLRSLLARWKGEPFVVLGVNGDSRERLRELEQTGTLAVKSWADGRPGGNAIAKLFQVQFRPVALVIDRRGGILFAGLEGVELEVAVNLALRRN